MPCVKLALGTVQFGRDYGISNTGGQTGMDEAASILAAARQAGIRTLDTAPAYGGAEGVLGRLVGADPGFDIVTKFSMPEKPMGGRVVQERFQASLDRLQRRHVYGLLFHSASDLLSADGENLFSQALELKEQGVVRKLGVSVYDAAELRAVRARHAIDLVQIPLNVLDQRLVRSGDLAELKQCGIEVHARSVFLQGLLLMAPEDVPPYFAPFAPLLSRFKETAAANGLTRIEAAFAFVAGLADIDRIVIGVNTAAQLNENIAAFRRSQEVNADWSDLGTDDVRLVNPALWRTSNDSRPGRATP